MQKMRPSRSFILGGLSIYGLRRLIYKISDSNFSLFYYFNITLLKNYLVNHLIPKEYIDIRND